MLPPFEGRRLRHDIPGLNIYFLILDRTVSATANNCQCKRMKDFSLNMTANEFVHGMDR